MRTFHRLAVALVLALLLAPILAAPATAQEEGEEEAGVDLADLPVERMGEVVVTATRTRQRGIEVSRALNVVGAQRIVERGVASAVDALEGEEGIWIEKRTAHTSDLVIRGLSGANLLALVDGNTLSTFWGEGGFAGDDMYGKIDPWMVERIEVVRGPGSVLYGSNALGGVVNFITKESPFDYTDCGIRVGGGAKVLASTAPSGWRSRLEGWAASPRVRLYAGVTHLDFGSTRDGSGQHQSPTAARGIYAETAVNVRLSHVAEARFTVQYTGLDPVYRYYRPNQSNENERLAFAGWLEVEDLHRYTTLADRARLGVYYQDKEDTRHFFDPATGLETRYGVARWKTIQADLQLDKQLGCHALTYGIEFESTDGESPDDEQFTIHFPNGVVQKAAPDSIWSSLGLYVQDVWRLGPRWTLTGSVRADVLRFTTDPDAQYMPAGGLDPSVDDIEDWQVALVGGLHAMYHLNTCTGIYGGWTRGFRQFAPRFGVAQTGFGVVVPNEFLDPVTADQFELGIKHDSPYIDAGLVGYYTFFDSFQNVVRGSFQGQDWYDFDGDMMRGAGEDVYVNVGNGEAYVYGIEAHASVNLAAIAPQHFGRAWTVSGAFTWNYGQDETNDIPIRHTQPMAAMVKVRWEVPKAPPRLWAELEGRFVDRFDRIPPSRLAGDVGYLEDPQDPTSGMRRTWGLPGYSVWDMRAGFILSEHAELTVGVTNLFDKLYRPAHARWDAPGRSFFATLSVAL